MLGCRRAKKRICLVELAMKCKPARLSLAVVSFVAVTGTMVVTPSISFASSPATHHQGGAVTVSVSPTTAQTMQGFGASGAWWPNDLVSFPRTVQEKVADLLFSKPGIDLSAYRYNVGGGGLGVTNPTRAAQSFLT